MTFSSIDHGVRLDVAGSVATVTIDRPDKRNALGLAAWRALPELIRAAEQDRTARVIVVRGAAGHFGAGNDIAEFGALQGDPGAAGAFGAAMAEAMRSIEDAGTPVVMAIEGMCYGASVALALAGDLRIAADNAVFAITPAKLGALYLRSDLHRLSAAVGNGQAKRLIFSAEAIGADEALRIGLVDEAIAQDRFETRLQQLIAAIVGGSPFTIRRTKQMLRDVGSGPAPVETRESLAAFVEATQGADFAEGIAAFGAKRSPQFGGSPRSS
ncbi:enoyl-CoA hydratase/carnithine racemase [Sphingomonas vulcanisoli]|uniref:Enoyl-CoA hydratase/carnithine racemase n=1 Tax=Sphingomonas vulcanisoli TaxID=1658060 RepID=A0ABX0TSA3_9SPHN|nr:enoyl-CoA hydratase/isomerase family protein [Sphingomonas vulcanisoli]NIJ08398.1 enoyl-CoA hydratase/carnithine racemase [Sphingomonas vulcanisoli]